MTAEYPEKVTTQLKTAVNNLSLNLDDDVGENADEILVQSTEGAPASGSFHIENEIIFYPEKTSIKFGPGLTRGADGTTKAVHLKTLAGGEVKFGPEAHFINNLNDELIATQTALGAGYDKSGWIPAGTFTYASATTITVASGAALIYKVNDKIKFTQTTGGTKYAYVTIVADTLLTINLSGLYTLENEAITAPYYSHIVNPLGFPVLPTSKLIATTRNMGAVSADVSYTGVGFTPTSIQVIGLIQGTFTFTTGVADSSKANHCVYQYGNNTFASGSFFISLNTSSSDVQLAIVKSFDADGFTLTWTKENSPTGTAALKFLCFR